MKLKDTILKEENQVPVKIVAWQGKDGKWRHAFQTIDGDTTNVKIIDDANHQKFLDNAKSKGYKIDQIDDGEVHVYLTKE
jgi:hypothetical protein